MSSLAKKLQQEQTKHTEVKTKKVVIPNGITLGEKVLYISFALFIAFFAVKIISTQADIYAINRDIVSVESKIEDQTKANKDLTDHVCELSTYDRIWAKAKELGLTLKDQNVKVVEN